MSHQYQSLVKYRDSGRAAIFYKDYSMPGYYKDSNASSQLLNVVSLTLPRLTMARRRSYELNGAHAGLIG
jgi:hypothetical protein